MDKKNKSGKIYTESPPNCSPGSLDDDSFLSFFELFTQDSGRNSASGNPCAGCSSKDSAQSSSCGASAPGKAAGIGPCGESAAREPVVSGLCGSGPAGGAPFADLCGACPSQGNAAACSGRAREEGIGETAADCARKEEEPLPVPTEEERAAILAMDYETISRVLREEEPIAVAVATEFIVHYALKVAEVLRNGEEYHHVVKPDKSAPVVEWIAMEIVRSSVASSLEAERLEQLGYGA